MRTNIRETIKGLVQSLPKIVRDTVTQFQEAQLFIVASSLAYTTLLSIIPLLALSFAIFQAFGGLNHLYKTIEPLILSNLAEGASDEVLNKLHEYIDNTHAGIVGAGGFIGLVFSCMSMLASAEKAINHVWRVKITRSLFHRIASYWLFITLGPLALSIAVGIATSSKVPLVNLLPSGVGSYAIVVICFTLAYKWVPQTLVKWSYAIISANVAAALWTLAKVGYNFYTGRVVSYHKVYGSLGAIPLLMLWIYIEWIIALTGAALCAALQKRIPKTLS
jgi:membrane protein